jgi:PAS domain S-box-containing protein
VRPENAADEWEKTALEEFAKGVTKYSAYTEIMGKQHFRSMTPFFVDESCMKCHARQGYKLGDIRGGISVAIPIEVAWNDYRNSLMATFAGHGALWLIGLFFISVGNRKLTASWKAQKDSYEESTRRLMESEQLISSSLDALNANIAILDANGVIVSVNEGWRRYAIENGAQIPDFGIGLNYFDICSQAQDECSADAVQVSAMIRELLEGKRSEFLWEYPCHGPEEQRWFEVRGTMFSFNNEPRVVLAHEDITRRKRSATRLHFLARSLDLSSQAFVCVDAEGAIIEFNDAFCMMTGFPKNELSSINWRHEIVPPKYSELISGKLAQLVKTGEPVHFESELIRKDGTLIPVESHFDVTSDPSSSLSIYFGFIKDISERKLSEEMLRASEERFRTFVEVSPVGLWATDPLGHNTYASPNWSNITGISYEDAKGTGWSTGLHPEDRERVFSEWMQAALAGRPYVSDFRFVRPDGNIVWVLCQALCIKDKEGKIREWLGVITDITAHKQAQERLRGSQSTLLRELEIKQAINSILEPLLAPECSIAEIGQVVLEQARKLTKSEHGYVNETDPENGDQVSLTLTEMLGKECSMCVPNQARFPKGPDGIYPGLWGHSLNTRKSFFTNTPDRHPASKGLPNGHVSLERFLSVPVFFGDELVGQIALANPERDYDEKDLELIEKLAGYYGLGLQKKRTMEAQNILISAINNASEGFVITDSSGKTKFANPAFCSMTGYSNEELSGHYALFLESQCNDEATLADITLAIKSGLAWAGTLSCSRKDGNYYIGDVSLIPVRSDRGDIANIVSIVRDISQEVRLQEQLAQSQKMEAIGTLAGGIAHDFNNIIFAIIGYAELAKDMLSETDPVQPYLKHILESGDRAANMIRQILTFSHQSNPEKTALNITPIIKEGLKFLRGAIPSSVEIIHDIRQDLPNINADPTQVYQILMNLCTNAAYSMKTSGGTLSVTLSAVELGQDFTDLHGPLAPGKYVRLTVADTGAGISPKIISRIFEPYFTTKSVGEGTGLGLSVLHGIVKSYGGTVTVYSEPGQGATFNVFFPTVGVEPHHVEEADTEMNLFGNERILWVDDEKILIEMSRDYLENLGYVVTSTQYPLKALELFRKNPQFFDVVVTDLTMPKMSGIELAAEMSAIRPDIPIIMCTGFSHIVSESETLRAGIVSVIHKPIYRNELVRTIRKVIDLKA